MDVSWCPEGSESGNQSIFNFYVRGTHRKVAEQQQQQPQQQPHHDENPLPLKTCPLLGLFFVGILAFSCLLQSVQVHLPNEHL